MAKEFAAGIGFGDDNLETVKSIVATVRAVGNEVTREDVISSLTKFGVEASDENVAYALGENEANGTEG